MMHMNLDGESMSTGLTDRAKRRMMQFGAAVAAAAALMAGSVSPAQAAEYAQINRTLYLTAKPRPSAYAATDWRLIYLSAGTYVWQVLLWNEATNQIVPGSRKERSIYLAAGTYGWRCGIGGDEYYTYTEDCLLDPAWDTPGSASMISENFGIGSNGSYTLIGRLIPG